MSRLTVGSIEGLTENSNVISVPTGHSLNVADGIQVDGQYMTPYTGRKNLIINGNFDVWQRGTGPFTGSGDYSADRWTSNSSGATISVTQQSFTDGQTDVPGNPRYFLRLDVTTGNDNCRIIQKIEDVRTCSNETVTVSFWAKGTARSFDVKFRQQFDGSTEVYTDLGSYTPSSSWQKFSFTTTLPSVSGKTIGVNSYLGLGLCWQNDASTSAYTCDIAQVQVERGNKATPFEHRPYGEELELCKRYYKRYAANGNAGYRPWAGGIVNAATSHLLTVFHSPYMRAAPAFNFSQIADFDIEPFDAQPSALSLYSSGSNTGEYTNIEMNSSASYTQGHYIVLSGDVAGSWIEFDAEL